MIYTHDHLSWLINDCKYMKIIYVNYIIYITYYSPL